MSKDNFTIIYFLFIALYGIFIVNIIPDRYYSVFVFFLVVPTVILPLIYYFDSERIKKKIRFPTVEESGYLIISFIAYRIANQIYFELVYYFNLPVAQSSPSIQGKPIYVVIALFIASGIYTPFVEEFVWRDILQERILSKQNAIISILVASMSWSILHVFSYGFSVGSLVVIGSIFISGLIYGILYKKHKT